MEQQDPKIPEITPQVIRSDSEKKGGAFAGLLAKLGLGGSGAAGGAVGGAAGAATGGGLLASKAGIVALIVAGSSVAAGIGMLTSVTKQADPAILAERDGFLPEVGEDSAAAASQRLADAQAASAVSPDGVSGSLDFFNQANQGAVQDPAAAGSDSGSEAGADEWSDSAASSDSGVAAPNNNVAASKAGSGPGGRASMARPAFKKKGGFGGKGGSGSTSAQMVASASMGGSTGGGMRKLAGGGGKMGAMGGAARSSRGARSRRAAGPKTKNMATSQLKSHSGALGRNMRSGNVSSAGSGTVMDGSGYGGNIGSGAGNIVGGGGGSQDGGIDSARPNENPNLDTKEVPDPVEDEDDGENKAPYQTEMMIAIGCIGVAVVCFFGLNMIKKKMDALKATAATPAGQAAMASLLSWGKVLMGIATAAAAVATAIGVKLTQPPYEQMMLGAILGAVGGYLTLTAGYKFYNLMSLKPDLKVGDVAEENGYTAKAATDAISAGPFDGFTKMLGMGAK